MKPKPLRKAILTGLATAGIALTGVAADKKTNIHVIVAMVSRILEESRC